MPLHHVTIVGASVAGLGVAQALRRKGFDGAITVFDSEREPAVQRPALSKRFLTEGLPADAIRLRTDLDGIDVRLGMRALGFDLRDRTLRLRELDTDRKEAFTVDGLVVATGAAARTLPMPSPPGVHVLRSLTDAEEFRADLVGASRVVIIGAGFVGSEVASSCRTLGLDVTLVEAGPAPMSRTLGTPVGMALAALHRDHGTRLRLGVGVAAFTGTDWVTGVRLTDGEVLPADVVLVGVGARPAVDWLDGSGVPVADGVRCGPDLATADRVVAVGDVARWPHHRGGETRVEHWENAVRQTDVAAATLLDPRRARAFAATTMFWSDQYDCKLQLIGHPQPGDSFSVAEGSLDERRYVGVYARDGKISAALLINQPHRMRAYRDAVQDAAPLPLATGQSVQPIKA